MSRRELERRLMKFVAGMRTEAHRPLAIGLETALFEEGIVNSLRILDLIAFVEEVTGTRVPDASVRLENFRSVRAIAAAFGGDCEDVMGNVARGEEPIRVFARHSGRAGYARPVEALAARGEIDLVTSGRASFRGAARRLLERFDTIARRWAVEAGALEQVVPARLPRDVLARAGCPAGRSALGESLVPPAVCYHVYHEREGARLDGSPIVVTLRGRCLRDEESFDLAGGRLRDFEMREIVILGSREDVERFRQEMVDRVAGLVSELDLEGRLEIASDPFFLQGAGDEARSRRLMQQVLPLKLELRLPLDRGHLCAVASFNHHLDFFGRRFRIRLASGATAHTGCVAFGLERWTLAFLARHGTDDSAWPISVRESLSQEVEA